MRPTRSVLCPGKPSMWWLGFFVVDPMTRCRWFFLILFATAPVPAQESLREYEVAHIRFEGNETLRNDLLLGVMQTRPTPAAFWKFLYTISEKLGDKPEYFDPFVFDADFERLKTFYQDQGFFNSQLDTSIVFDPSQRSVALTIRVQEGRRSMIDSIRYIGFDHLPGELRDEIHQNSLVKVGDPFIMGQVVAERARLVNAFFNTGFIQVRVDTVVGHLYESSGNVLLLFAFNRGERFRFGEVVVQQDSTGSEPVGEEVIHRHLDFKPGDFYSEARKVGSERNLNRLGVFETSRVEPQVNTVAESLLTIPMRVFARSRPFQELVPEIGVNDENNAFNIQMGLGYANRNFYGGARNFSTRLRLQVQSIQDVEFSRVFGGTGLKDSTVLGSAELSIRLVQPYFFNNKTTLTPSISYLIEKKTPEYYNPIFIGRVNVASQFAQYTSGAIEWNLERVAFETVDPNVPLPSFSETDPDRRPQFNSIVTFTIQRDRRNDIFNPSSGFVHSASVEEAGILPSLFGGVFGSKLPYSTYYKLSGFLQWYWDPSEHRDLIWAFRTRGGFAELYGNSPAPVPITRRFYAGGSGSIRGWKARDLGAVIKTDEGGTAFVEANLEARWNPLKNAGKFAFVEFNRLSFVFFFDMGNVWTDLRRVRASETAMASGVGIRYDTVAGPIRIDFGFRVYDPSAPRDHQWITQKRFFKETLSDLVPHIGIGHSF